MSKRYLLPVLFVSIVATTAIPSSAFSVPMFMGLGDLPEGDFGSFAADISGDGTTVVGHSSSTPDHNNTQAEAFRWTLSEGMVGLGKDSKSGATGVSFDGSVIVGSNLTKDINTSTGITEAFRWTQTDGKQGIGFLPGKTTSFANEVSADGNTIIGNSSDNTPNNTIEAFKWNQTGGMTGLGDLPGGDYSSATGISGDGKVIVGVADLRGAREGVMWTESNGIVSIGADLVPIGASYDGSVIAGFNPYESAGRQAFRYTESVGIDYLGLGNVLGISADGSLILGGDMYFGESSLYEGAGIWNADGNIRSILDIAINDLGLDMTGWYLRNVTGISDDLTTIVGNGTNANGDSEAWIIKSDIAFSEFDYYALPFPPSSIPEPSILALLSLGLFGIGVARSKA